MVGFPVVTSIHVRERKRDRNNQEEPDSQLRAFLLSTCALEVL